MAGWQPLCYKQSPAFTRKFQKKVSLFLQKHTKTSLFVKTTASPITTIRRVLYPLVIITLYYLEKLRNCYIYWIHFVSPINTWTIFIPCSSTDSAEKLLQRVETCLTMYGEQSRLTKETEEWTTCRILQKKKLLRKKFKQHFMSALRMNKSTLTSGSVFAERIENVRKTKFELEPIKIVDCFPDGHGNYDSNLVSFKIESL